MNAFYKIICFCFFLLTFSIATMGQYVTLQGKQFKDENGADFYPLVCNYIVAWAYDGSNYFLSTPLFNQYNSMAECQERVQQDFHQMKQMGFNTVRIVQADINKTKYDYPKCTTNEYKDHFAITYEEMHHDGSNSCSLPVYPANGEGRAFLDIYAPYDNTNTNLNLVLAQTDVLLNMAETAGLKVILLTGGGKYLVNSDVYPAASGYSGTKQDQHAADYAALLSYYTDHFKNNTTIMAYDVWNEPAYTDNEYFHTKNEVCQWTAQWYDAIKSSDPNHLITMGMAYYNDVLEWDISVIKLDFISQHIYPILSPADNYDLNAAMKRFHNDWIWVANNSPMPWIVGETSFSASNNAVSPYNVRPYTNGNEAEQADFTETSLNIARNAGGSGYSWWLFQDVSWYPPTDPGYYLNWYGLMRHADPVGGVYNAADEKPAVDVIRNYLDVNGNPPPITPVTATNSYYNPYNHPTNPVGEFGQPTTITGNVKDQNGQPIKDAFVLGATILYVDDSGPDDIHYLHSHYTLTDDNGDFIIKPYDYDPRLPNTNKIEDIRISAFGTERVERGWPSSMNPLGIGVTNGENFILQQTDLQNNPIFTGLTVSGTQHFEARQTLTVTDVVVSSGANSDFKAASEVNVGTEFHAESGSETHLFIEVLHPECTDFTGYLRQKNPMSDVVEEEMSNLNTEIEIQFKKQQPEWDVVIQPNPNQGKYTLLLETSETTTVHTNLEIYSLTGNKVYSQVLNTKIIEMNISHLGKGIYIISIIQNNNIINKKLIIQ